MPAFNAIFRAAFVCGLLVATSAVVFHLFSFLTVTSHQTRIALGFLVALVVTIQGTRFLRWHRAYFALAFLVYAALLIVGIFSLTQVIPDPSVPKFYANCPGFENCSPKNIFLLTLQPKEFLFAYMSVLMGAAYTFWIFKKTKVPATFL